ncbi:MAG TPA: hypothetical protein VFI46_08095 [Jiangellaceae bacterium]|nr:hypothetical protein [Jiangellaceae bacterium]
MSAIATAAPAGVRRIDRGRNHWYVGPDGTKLAGVTSILKAGVPAPALIRWASNSVAEYAIDRWDELEGLAPSERLKRLKGAPWAERDAAAVRGQDVHGLAERLGRGERVDVPEPLRGHVESCVRFLDDWDAQPVLSECTVYSLRWSYAGTLDLIADLADGQRWLLDFKTGRGVYGETALQLAAYRYAEHYTNGAEEHVLPEVDTCGVVHLRSDGYDLLPVEAGPREHRDFLYAAAIARFADRSRDLIGAPLDPPIREDYS